MIIDSHVHIWLRDHLPDSLVRAYLEPLAILKEVMDWEVDTDTAWPEYAVDAQKIMDMLKDERSGQGRGLAHRFQFGRDRPHRHQRLQYLGIRELRTFR